MKADIDRGVEPVAVRSPTENPVAVCGVEKAGVILIRAGVSCWVFCLKIDIEHAEIDAPLMAIINVIARLERLLTVIQPGYLIRCALPNRIIQTQLVAVLSATVVRPMQF